MIVVCHEANLSPICYDLLNTAEEEKDLPHLHPPEFWAGFYLTEQIMKLPAPPMEGRGRQLISGILFIQLQFFKLGLDER